MGQAWSTYFTPSSRGEDGSVGPVGVVSSNMIGELCVTVASTSPSSSQSRYDNMSDQQISADIETSKQQGWSELVDAAVASSHPQDSLIWKEMKTRCPHVFRDDVNVKMGRLIAEGGQAQIYEASLEGDDQKFVAKVFKKGFSLADLQRQWPLATRKPRRVKGLNVDDFVLGEVIFGELIPYCSGIHLGTPLNDGRFAFLMEKYWGDLRTLINLKLSEKNFQGPPFSFRVALGFIEEIALGMENLHARGVWHRDLKAANILLYNDNPTDLNSFTCQVADFESSMLTIGTGFWRAPELLMELQKVEHKRNAKIWTEKVDVYSFAMTCYEILTGLIPFPDYGKSNWKNVIDGERPILPYSYIECELIELVQRCWHFEPSERPTFRAIVKELKIISNSEYASESPLAYLQSRGADSYTARTILKRGLLHTFTEGTRPGCTSMPRKDVQRGPESLPILTRRGFETKK